jgi:hypothetical protein
MNTSERIEYLKTQHTATWNSTRRKVFDELSDNQSMFCCCGKLATGLHEQNCRKFNNKVDRETANRLKDLETTIERYEKMSFMSSESTGHYPTSKD